MPIPAFGYVILPAADTVPAEQALGRESIKGYAERHNLSLGAVFVAVAEFARLPWFARPGGKQLAAQLGLGSQIVVPDLAAVWTSAPDPLERPGASEEEGDC